MRIPIAHLVVTCTVAALCAAGVAAAQQVPTVPGAQTERFRLVVEGEVRAVSDLDLGATTAVCTAQVNAHMVERATWRRGRGVVVQFTRLGAGRSAPVLMTRVGSARPQFTVVVTSTRTSSGSATRTPVGPPEACPPLTEDLSKGPECDAPKVTRAAVSILYAGGTLRIQQTGLGALVEIECPVSEVAGGALDVRYAWPGPPPVRAASLPRPLIFGKRRAFVVRTDSPRRRDTRTIALGPLSGSATDFGHNRVTVRFIRLT